MIGAQHARAAAGTDPRGWLVFTELPSDLQSAEDSTAVADAERSRNATWDTPAVWGSDDPLILARLRRDAAALIRAARLDRWGTFARPATVTERALLAHLGYELPDELLTVVSRPTSGVRRRRWPTLEGTTP